MNTTFAELTKKAREVLETAALTQEQVDLQEMTSEELVTFASLTRLYRLADARYDQIVSDHVNNCTNVHTTDRMVDIMTKDYLLELPLSFDRLADFVNVMIAQAQKFGIKVPTIWEEMGMGMMEYKSEFEKD